ncbi:MAG: hypothetical protein M3162_05640 [Thermoproteota archaeon]|nr:hypothetical protein [Thermoproteota archaeon]
MNKINNISRLTVLFIFASLLTNPVFFNNQVQASIDGLKVNVHINKAGKICVSSPVEDLGCKTSSGAGIVNFQFPI